MITLNIIALCLLGYSLWLMVGVIVLKPKIRTKLEKTKYQCRNWWEAGYELTIWPKVLSAIDKKENE